MVNLYSDSECFVGYCTLKKTLRKGTRRTFSGGRFFVGGKRLSNEMIGSVGENC